MKTPCLAAFLVLSSAAVAEARESERTERTDHAGVDLAVRVGYAIPFGDVDGDRGSLSGRVSGAIPFIIEAGYRFDRHFTLGPYFQYAIAQIAENANTGCNSNTDCSGWIVRAGLEGLYHLDVKSVIAPWVGLGFGYVWTNYSGTFANVAASASANGWEFANLQAGGDFRLGQTTTLGPFISFAIARYSHESGTLGGLMASSDVTSPAVHEWLQLGARLGFEL
jgi:hypothetical protein